MPWETFGHLDLPVHLPWETFVAGIKVVVAALRNHPGNSEVQKHGRETLVKLSPSAAGTTCRNGIAKAGGIEAVVAALRSDQENSELQKHGCGFLDRLSGDVENAVRIAEAGGIAAVVAALNSHQKNSDIQIQGCRALSKIAAKAQASATSAARFSRQCIPMWRRR